VTPLHRAVRARSPAAVAALLSAGASPRAATAKAGSTPLHLAVAPTGASGTAGAATTSSRSSTCSWRPAPPWPTRTATASPCPTAFRARPCARRWPARS
jgi:ankyrin repeat protein